VVKFALRRRSKTAKPLYFFEPWEGAGNPFLALRFTARTGQEQPRASGSRLTSKRTLKGSLLLKTPLICQR